jgi:small subunit ribosomal protein S9
MIEKTVESGKRKTSVARAIISPGKGIVTINKKDYRNLQTIDRLRVEEPLMIAEKILGNKNFDIRVDVKGGGEKGQIEAARLAIAKSIVAGSKSEELKKAYGEYDKHLLVADIRRKEARKPGDSKARAKRQTSYR